jgi:hypothetical protein
LILGQAEICDIAVRLSANLHNGQNSIDSQGNTYKNPTLWTALLSWSASFCLPPGVSNCERSRVTRSAQSTFMFTVSSYSRLRTLSHTHALSWTLPAVDTRADCAILHWARSELRWPLRLAFPGEVNLCQGSLDEHNNTVNPEAKTKAIDAIKSFSRIAGAQAVDSPNLTAELLISTRHRYLPLIRLIGV